MSGETWNSAGVDAALSQLGREVGEILQSEDMTGAVSARVIDAPELPVFSFHEEEVFPAASLYKLAVMMAFCREVDHGVLEPSALVDLSPQTEPKALPASRSSRTWCESRGGTWSV